MPLLFSYGTLQQQGVQLSTFGRPLDGQKDELVGFEATRVPIVDPQAAAASGTTHHANVMFTGRHDSRVGGTVFEITDEELAAATGTRTLPRMCGSPPGLGQGKRPGSMCTVHPGPPRDS
jgi:hypothetical protein